MRESVDFLSLASGRRDGPGVFGDPEKAGAKLNVSNLAVIQRAATVSDRLDLKPPWLTASGQTAILLDCLTAPNRLGSQSRAPPECSEGQDHARRNRGGRVGSRKPRPSGGHIGFSNMNREQKQSMKLEDLQANAAVHGILSDSLVTVVSVQWFGSEALELTYKTPTGMVANELLYRHDEARLEIVEVGRPWSFDGDGALFRLVSEAQRIRLAHLFDPVLALHTSVVEPLTHQITAVYESMLSRQPLRFLLADDPGAGKTIMAGQS